jgi:hypothetical protein
VEAGDVVEVIAATEPEPAAVAEPVAVTEPEPAPEDAEYVPMSEWIEDFDRRAGRAG